uniref:S-acyltransferase n=1 Tax=Globodera pallida TaxID=36090 RepID=A0A183CRT5_GLOPA
GIIYLHYALLLLLIVTSIGDLWVKIMNQKQLNRSAKYGNYSASLRQYERPYRSVEGL